MIFVAKSDCRVNWSLYMYCFDYIVTHKKNFVVKGCHCHIFGHWKNFFFLLPQVEVFDILFVLEQDKKFIVHCQDCARKIHPRLEGFVVLKQYQTSQLCEIFDRFQLAHHVSPCRSSKGKGDWKPNVIFVCKKILVLLPWMFFAAYQSCNIFFDITNIHVGSVTKIICLKLVYNWLNTKHSWHE